ncbi:ATP-binding cassette domain-containing protein [Streptomyces lomondensis]|uniref:ABC transporter ATP-binding protein n=1 Tax=Streptomyces lomondensis TaxID=68229 RepID=A0ABQ2X5H7_9ACTN|nr:ABC transporter ATP-binding protein [Streptomyces lomondensis]MCF0078139.1 ABC transporter ATP-binding protein/permease [Streptomyces lomondensis]GGX00663.1 ABC transporter ATP-binding protein [Streptomyces lomondensis]
MSRRSVQILRSSLSRRRREYGRLVAWSLVQAVPAFLSGWLVARAVDRGFLADRPATGFLWLGALAAAYVVGAWATRHAVLGLAALIEPFRDELTTLVTEGTLHRSARLGEPADTAGVARLTEHVERARDAYGAIVLFVQGFLVTAVGVLLGLAGLIVLVALVLPPLLLGLALFAAALRAMAARQREVILADERVAGTAGDLTGGLRDVVACGAEDRMGAAAGAHVDDAARATLSLARLTAVRTAALGISGWVPLLLILVAAPWLVRNGVTAGAILGAVTYVSQALQPALQGFVQGLGSSGLWLLVTVGRMAEVAAESRPGPGQGVTASDAVESGAAGSRPGSARGVTASGPGASDAAASRPEQAQGAAASWPGGREAGEAGPSVARPGACRVEVRGLTFAYARSADPVLRDVNLLLRPGEHLAVVGPSGAGKSTLAALIAGVLEPQAGQVYLDDLPVRALVGRGEGLARHRVLIPQEAYVFAGTLAENLTYLAPGAPRADVESAVRAVGAAPLVERLGGYDAPLDPRRLSAGERQLVALARALLPAPRLVLLDEATCHLDPFAEAVAEDAFARGPGTLIVVAHRISSALRADRVLVMDGTRLALGTHEQLMAASSLYRDLVGHWGAAGAAPGSGDRPARPTAGAMARTGMAAALRMTAQRISGRARTSRKGRGRGRLTPSRTPGRSGSRRSDYVPPSSA